MGPAALGGVGGRGRRGWRVGGGGGRGIPEETSDVTAEAFPQMKSCRAGLREHKEFVKSAAPFTLKIKKSEEEISNSNRRRGKGRRQKSTELNLEIRSQPHSGLAPQNTLHFFFLFEHRCFTMLC